MLFPCITLSWCVFSRDYCISGQLKSNISLGITKTVYTWTIDVMYKNHYMQIYTVREIDILYAELPTRTNKHSTNIV